MAKTKPAFDDFLAIATRAELRAAVTSSRLPFSLPEAQRLISHAESLEPAAHPLRLGIIHTYTSDLLDPWLHVEAALQGLELQTYHAPYGLTVQEAQPNSGLVKHAPDMTLLLLRREDLHPDLANPLVGFGPARQEERRREVVDRLF